LAALSSEQITEADAQFNAAQAAQRMAGLGRSQGTMTWTPEGGFQSAGTSGQGSGSGPTIGAHRAGGQTGGRSGGGTGGTGGRPGRGGTGRTGGTQSGSRGGAPGGRARSGAVGNRAELAAAAIGAAGSRSPVTVDDPGIGALRAGADDYDTFELQMLGVVNMRLPANAQKTSFTQPEKDAVRAQWNRARQAHSEQMIGLTIQAQSRAIVQQRREAASNTDGAHDGPHDGAGGGSTGAPTAGGHTATRGTTGSSLQHPHNEDQIDVDKIDVEELVARIYDRVRSRLRSEFLIDRERAGLLTDFR
jgi:hypothetical protein